MHSCQIQTSYMKFKWWVLPIGIVRCTMRVLRHTGEYFPNAKWNYIINSAWVSKFRFDPNQPTKVQLKFTIFFPIKLSFVDLSGPGRPILHSHIR